jgi:hypothetical protein
MAKTTNFVRVASRKLTSQLDMSPLMVDFPSKPQFREEFFQEICPMIFPLFIGNFQLALFDFPSR